MTIYPELRGEHSEGAAAKCQDYKGAEWNPEKVVPHCNTMQQKEGERNWAGWKDLRVDIKEKFKREH